MTNKMLVMLVYLSVVTIGLPCSTFSEEIPCEVQEAAQRGLRDFINLSSTGKSVIKFENGNVVSDLASSYLGTPYKQLLISSEGILDSREPKELLDNCKDDGYVFPICNDNMIIAFMTVNYLYLTEKGIMGWIWGGIRFQ